jgi:plasmid stability protein
MSNILVRDLSPETVSNLKERAKRNHRSLQAEVRDILEREGRMARLTNLEALRIFEEIAERAGPQTSDSVDLIREDRDR